MRSSARSAARSQPPPLDSSPWIPPSSIVAGAVYLWMLLDEIPRLDLDRTGVALLGAIALLLGLTVISAQFRLGGLYGAVTARLAARPASWPWLRAARWTGTRGAGSARPGAPPGSAAVRSSDGPGDAASIVASCSGALPMPVGRRLALLLGTLLGLPLMTAGTPLHAQAPGGDRLAGPVRGWPAAACPRPHRRGCRRSSPSSANATRSPHRPASSRPRPTRARRAAQSSSAASPGTATRWWWAPCSRTWWTGSCTSRPSARRRTDEDLVTTFEWAYLRPGRETCATAA